MTHWIHVRFLTLHLYYLSFDYKRDIRDYLFVNAVLRRQCHYPRHLLRAEHYELAVQQRELLLAAGVGGRQSVGWGAGRGCGALGRSACRGASQVTSSATE